MLGDGAGVGIGVGKTGFCKDLDLLLVSITGDSGKEGVALVLKLNIEFLLVVVVFVTGVPIDLSADFLFSSDTLFDLI